MPRPLLMILALFALGLAALGWPAPASADPADINAAARGVVRVVLISREGGEIYPISHGTGFAVGPETIITNAHVVSEVIEDSRLSLGIVPSDGGEAVFARLLAVSSRNDLALLETTSPMRLPPLTISGNPASDAGAVTAVGYPQNVDRAQGLAMEDIFRAQPPVKSMGFLSGRRPSRDFDTLLHTAPIARGSSGGPLLDDCGRVVGVNSFGAESSSADAEFFFAVSTRELLPFLRANSVTPRLNGMPCRSLADLEQADRTREQQRRAAAEAEASADERALARRREDALRTVEFAVLEQRENLMGLAFLLLVASLGAGALALHIHERREELEDELADPAAEVSATPAPAMLVAGAIALAALAGAAGAWYARPGFAEIDSRLEDLLRAEMAADDHGPIAVESSNGALSCTLAPERSRITGEAEPAIDLDWNETGCVNGRTQYGVAGAVWTRVFVPANEAAVSVNRFDPASGEFVVERYLLDREAMSAARAARGQFEAPSCPASPDEARMLGREQDGLVGLLPRQPNERLVYDCVAAN